MGAFNPATSNSDPLQVNQAQDVSAATTSSDAASTDSSATSFQAGDFQCIDDTKFKQFTSATSFVVNSCPPGFCVTRSPPKKNPCIGKEKALQIDGKLESPASNSDTLQNSQDQAPDVSAATTFPDAATSSDAASTDSSATSFQAGDFQCIDDTKFKQFTSATSFVVNSCPPGFCVTRSPPKKNPCIGKEKALQIDGKLES